MHGIALAVQLFRQRSKSPQNYPHESLKWKSVRGKQLWPEDIRRPERRKKPRKVSVTEFLGEFPKSSNELRLMVANSTRILQTMGHTGCMLFEYLLAFECLAHYHYLPYLLSRSHSVITNYSIIQFGVISVWLNRWPQLLLPIKCFYF